MTTSQRLDYTDPAKKDLMPGMMLRIGSKDKPSVEWRPAILLEIKAHRARVLFYPGVYYEKEGWINVAAIRLAWIVFGIDFLSLCKRFSGAQVFSSIPLRIYH